MKHFFTIVLVVSFFQLSAQGYKHMSYAEFINPNSALFAASGKSLVHDNAGNIYFISAFDGQLIMESDTIVPLNFNGDFDLVLTKLNAQGHLIWMKPFGGSATDEAIDLAVDDSANLYARVFLQGAPILFNDTILNAGGDIIKFDSSGNFKWITTLQPGFFTKRSMVYSTGSLYAYSGGAIQRINPHTGAILNTLNPTFSTGFLSDGGMAVGPNGDIVLVGYLFNSICFGGDTLSDLNPSANGTGGNLFLIRVDTSLNVLDYKAYGGYYSGMINMKIPVVTDNSGNVYVGAVATDTVHFGSVVIPPTSLNQTGLFLKLNQSLAPIGASFFKSALIEPRALLNANNGIYLGGDYSGVAHFINGDSLVSGANTNNFIVKYNFNGNLIYETSSGSNGNNADILNDLSADANGNCYFISADQPNPQFGCRTISTPFTNVCVVNFTDVSDAVPQPTITLSNGVFTTSPIFNDTIQWFLNNVPIQGANSSTFSATQNGSYTCLYTNSFGCSSMSDSLNLLNVGVNNFSSDFEVLIFPNPSLTFQNIFVQASTNCSLQITDVLGRVLFDQKLIRGMNEIELKDCAESILIWKVLNAYNQELTGKIVRN